jgi:uncharacterized protein YjbJ (UPF0337 family)
MEDQMNTDQIKGKAVQLKGKIKEAFARLTDDDVALFDGQRDKFLGKLQEKYGLAKEDAEKRIRDLESERAA